MLTKCCPGSWFLPVGNGEVYSGLKPHGGPGARAEDGGEPGKPQGRGGALEMHRKEGRKPGIHRPQQGERRDPRGRKVQKEIADGSAVVV